MNAVLLSSESEVEGDQTKLQKLAARWGLINDSQANLALVITPDRLELRKLDEPKLGAIYVDLLSKAMNHRRRYGGGRNEAIAKAVGIKGQCLPDVVDATAGLGRDAFVLACLGCKVRMFERNPVVAALLADGLQRAYADTEFGPWLRKRLILHYGASLTALVRLMPPPDVVYLDPMFPHRKKSALVKKEMRIFQTLVGDDDDADNLLAPALAIALHRVVVKRPNFTQPLAGVTAQAYIKTKNYRFDIYKPQK